MEQVINDDYIIKYFQREDGTVKGATLASRIIDAHKEIASYMQNRFPFTQDYKEVYYLIYHGLKERPKCPVCGKEVPFAKFNIGYRKYCSLECQRSEKGKQIKKDCQKQTCLDKYGVSSVLQLEEVKKKAEETSLRKYGCKRPSQSEIVKQHTRENNLKKYGSVTHMSSSEVKDKIKQTCLERYGCENYSQTDEYKERYQKTCMERYGVLNSFQLDICKERRNEVLQNKYGVNYAFSNKDIQKRALEASLQSSSSKSKAEDAIYEELCCIYGKENIIRQYKSNMYPFHCDFYIQSEDLYIEYQGSWTHGTMPYVEGDTACVQQLQLWEEKAVNSDYYKDAIETWTYRDVIKRETAYKYNLNYIEIW